LEDNDIDLDSILLELQSKANPDLQPRPNLFTFEKLLGLNEDDDDVREFMKKQLEKRPTFGSKSMDEIDETL